MTQNIVERKAIVRQKQNKTNNILIRWEQEGISQSGPQNCLSVSKSIVKCALEKSF